MVDTLPASFRHIQLMLATVDLTNEEEDQGERLINEGMSLSETLAAKAHSILMYM